MALLHDEKLERQIESLGGYAKQGFQDIIWALLYGVGEARVRAAKEIRRLTKTSAQSRADLASAGVIIPLVSMIKSSNMEAKEAAMLALINMAVRNERNKIMIVKAGAVAPLVELLHSKSETLRESAAVAVLTLSASDSNKPLIGGSGATPLLVQMLTSGSLQGKVDAVMALYNLSTYEQNLLRILAAGAIPPLLMLLKECKKASKVAEKTTALLESLSVFEEGRSAISKEKGGILALVEVLEDGSSQSREYAVSALLTMCQSSRCEYRQAILQEGAIPGLLELTVHGTVEARQKAKDLLDLLRDSPLSPRSASDSSILDSLAYDIAAQVEKVQPGLDAAKKMLSEMVQLSMEQSMRCLQERAMASLPSA